MVAFQAMIWIMDENCLLFECLSNVFVHYWDGPTNHMTKITIGLPDTTMSSIQIGIQVSSIQTIYKFIQFSHLILKHR